MRQDGTTSINAGVVTGRRQDIATSGDTDGISDIEDDSNDISVAETIPIVEMTLSKMLEIAIHGEPIRLCAPHSCDASSTTLRCQY